MKNCCVDILKQFDILFDFLILIENFMLLKMFSVLFNSWHIFPPSIFKKRIKINLFSSNYSKFLDR